MKNIKWYLVSIFLLLLGTYIRVFYIGYEFSRVMEIVSIALPLIAVAVFLFALIDDRIGKK